MRSRRRRRAALAVLAALLLAVPVTALAQAFLARYKAGVEAVEREDWAQVVSHMRAAIGERSEEAPRLVAHFHFRPYVPHAYLGVALAERGDCPAALDAFAESERQGVIQELPEEYALLRQARDGCRQALARTAELAGEAEAAVATAAERLAGLDGLVEGSDLATWWSTGSPSPEALRGQAGEWLREARVALQGGDPARARELADRAARTATQLQERAAAERDRRRTQRQRAEAASGLDDAREGARRALAGVRDLRPYPPQLARRVGRLEELLAEAGREGLDLADIDRLDRELRDAAAALGRAAAPPPAAFLGAAEAFLGGRYDEVLSQLAEDRLPRGRARAHAHLLRAAAFFALARSGATPAEAEALPYPEAARREVEAALAADPDLRPPERFHSPAFRALVEEVRGAGADATDGAPRR